MRGLRRQELIVGEKHEERDKSVAAEPFKQFSAISVSCPWNSEGQLPVNVRACQKSSFWYGLCIKIVQKGGSFALAYPLSPAFVDRN